MIIAVAVSAITYGALVFKQKVKQMEKEQRQKEDDKRFKDQLAVDASREEMKKRPKCFIEATLTDGTKVKSRIFAAELLYVVAGRYIEASAKEMAESEMWSSINNKRFVSQDGTVYLSHMIKCLQVVAEETNT